MGLGLWLIIDIYRYVKYRQLYTKLNKENYDKPNNKKNIDKLINDLDTYPEFLEDLIKNIYYSKVRFEDMNFNDVCKAIYILTGEDPNNIERIKKIVKKYQIKIKKEQNRNIFKSEDNHPRIRDKNYKINAWFAMLPCYLLTRGINKLVHIYMRILGYKCVDHNNGIKIWYTNYDPKKGTPILFYHASVGGVVLQFTLLKHYYDNHNMIMPEIPGISFIDIKDSPPSIDDIIETTHKFISDKYFINNLNKNKINLMGHSIGNTICCGIINKYPELIDNFFCIEGQLFFHGAVKIYSDFEKQLKELSYEDLISVPFFHRDLYVQYFLMKKMTGDSFIYDLNDENNKHIKIHMFHIKSDNKIQIMPQIEYAKKKKIPLKYHIIEGEYPHGAFVLNSYVKNYVLEKIQDVYDNIFDNIFDNINDINKIKQTI